ncbi:MAG: HTTM domain-containing protein [Rhizobiaceae bacterium]|nr:HTTM domain-containing protein [Rhizobiaceae bacterium]
MTLEDALRATELLLAWALILQSCEHFVTASHNKALFLLRIICCIVLAIGIAPLLSLAMLAAISLIMLHRFQGPYNGGSDRMSVLIVWCLLIAHAVPTTMLREAAFGYLAAQVVLSYFISGWVKLVNPQWRSGRALRDVFAFSAYPVSEELRQLANYPRLCWVMAWSVMVFEVLFPIALVDQTLLIIALAIGAAFHLANACLFGLNRFFWIWLSAYPSLLWLQSRVADALW